MADLPSLPGKSSRLTMLAAWILRKLVPFLQCVLADCTQERHRQFFSADADRLVAHHLHGLHGHFVFGERLLRRRRVRQGPRHVADVEADDLPAAILQRFDEVVPPFQSTLLRTGATALLQVVVSLAGEDDDQVGLAVLRPRREERLRLDLGSRRRGRSLIRGRVVAIEEIAGGYEHSNGQGTRAEADCGTRCGSHRVTLRAWARRGRHKRHTLFLSDNPTSQFTLTCHARSEGWRLSQRVYSAHLATQERHHLPQRPKQRL